jgi:hypothetical protein
MVFIEFEAHMSLNSVQLATKPRTFLVAIGEAILGPPTVDTNGNNITADAWSSMSILQKIAIFGRTVGYGNVTESGVGVLKSVYISTVIQVHGYRNALGIIANSITCHDCFTAIQQVFTTYSFVDASSNCQLLDISTPIVLFNVSFPVTSAAPPRAAPPANLAAVSSLLLIFATIAATTAR